jgi:hypothetical protein
VIRLDSLPERTRDPIEAAAPAIVEVLGEGLVAVCLIGPAAKPGHNLRGAHAELLVIAELLGPEILSDLAGALAEPLRAGLQIRTVTRTELAGSVDVHALELAQWRDHHLLLAGSDPFAELEIAPADLRHEIERALRSLSQRLRNRMLWCLATEQRRLDAVLREGVELLTMLAHHTLTLVGEQPPSEEPELLERFVVWAGSDGAAITTLRERLEAPRAAEDPLAELAALAATTEAACSRVDELRLS